MKIGPFHLPKCTLFIHLFCFIAIIIFNYSCQDKSLVESDSDEFNVIELEPISVNKKLKSGLHSIQSIYCLIDLHDKIFLKKIKNKHLDQVSFNGPFSFWFYILIFIGNIF